MSRNIFNRTRLPAYPQTDAERSERYDNRTPYVGTPHVPGESVDPNAWRKQAACHGIPTEMFFRVGVPPKLVVETCARCPVRGECVTDAVNIEFDWTNGGHNIARGYRGVSATTRMRIHRAAP